MYFYLNFYTDGREDFGNFAAYLNYYGIFTTHSHFTH